MDEYSDFDEAYHDIPFRGIVEQSIVGVFVLQDDCFQYVNETFAAMIGLTQAEAIGDRLSQVLTPASYEALLEHYRRRERGGTETIRFVADAIHRDGSIRYVDFHGTRLEYRGRPAVVGVGIDVTERVAADAELHRSREQLRKLAAHIDSVREELRARFAREIHDVLGGMLTSIKMDITRILRRLDNPEVVGIARALLQLTQETIDEARRMSEELRPSALDHLGLTAAIASQLDDFRVRYGVACRLDRPAVEVRLPPASATAVYRIFQEALTNIARHAGASRVEVGIADDGQRLTLTVRDDGCGIDPAAPRGKTMGLFSMSERALEIGGALQIGPAPGGGTLLALTVPRASEAGANA